MAFGIGEGVALGGALMNLIGGNKKPQTSPYEQEQARLLRQRTGIAADNRRYAGEARQEYNALAPQRNAARNNYAGILSANPYTDTFRASRIGRMNADTNRLFDNVGTRTRAGAVRSGESPDVLAGQLSNVDASRAAAKSQQYLSLNQEEMNSRQDRARQLNALLSGAAQTAEDSAIDYSSLAAGGYENAGNENGNLARYDDARNARFEAGQGEETAQLATLLGTLLQGTNIDTRKFFRGVGGGVRRIGNNVGAAWDRLTPEETQAVGNAQPIMRQLGSIFHRGAPGY